MAELQHPKDLKVAQADKLSKDRVFGSCGSALAAAEFPLAGLQEANFNWPSNGFSL